MREKGPYFSQSDITLRARQRALLGGFMINCALVGVATIAAFLLDAGPAMARACGASGDADAYVARGLAAWGIGGFVIFLVPALATYLARGVGHDKNAGQYFTGKCKKSKI